MEFFSVTCPKYLNYKCWSFKILKCLLEETDIPDEKPKKGGSDDDPVEEPAKESEEKSKESDKPKDEVKNELWSQ